LIIWKAQIVDDSDSAFEPGVVTSAHGDELVVQCGGRSSLRLLEVQPEAKRRMSARDFLNGAHLKIGDRFGED
jgi:methionyl-tRNA formyltransferase